MVADCGERSMDEPKTIAVDLTPLSPGGANGGAKVVVLELLHQLSGLVPRGQFILLTQAASHEELASLERSNMRRVLTVHRRSKAPSRSGVRALASRLLVHLPRKYESRLRRRYRDAKTILTSRARGALLHGMGVDLLFCPFTVPTYCEPGILTICTIHDLQHKAYPEFFSADEIEQREEIFFEVCRKATAIATVSEFSRAAVLAHGGRGLPLVRTIHHRLAHRMSSQSRDGRALQHLGLTQRRYLLYPANFWKHKNHEALLGAFRVACHEKLDADIKLVCTGAPGPRLEWLKGFVRSMNLAERVVFPGYVDIADLGTLISNCAGVVFPSLYEGFGLPVLEAMAAGVPVACSNNTSLPEIAGEAALFFDPSSQREIANVMMRLVADEAQRARLIQAGRARVSEFSDTQRMAKEYWQLFQDAWATAKREESPTTGDDKRIAQVGPR